jgi:hypothetical protein
MKLLRWFGASKKNKQKTQQPLQEEKIGSKTKVVDFDKALRNLRDADPEKRRDAAKELGELGNNSAVPALIESLEDEDLEVQRRAAWSLGEIGDAAGVAPLINIINGGNEKIQIYARWSIWKIVDVCRKTETLDEFEKEFDRGLKEWMEKHPHKTIRLDVLDIKKEINKRKAEFLSQ